MFIYIFSFFMRSDYGSNNAISLTSVKASYFIYNGPIKLDKKVA